MALNMETVIGNQKSVREEDAKFRTAQSSRNTRVTQTGMLKLKWIAWSGTWETVMGRVEEELSHPGDIYKMGYNLKASEPMR